MAKIKEIYHVNDNDWVELRRILSLITNRLDKVEGYRGTPTLQSDVEFATGVELVNPILRNPTIISSDDDSTTDEDTYTISISPATAGDYLEVSDDTEESVTTGYAYTKIKEVYIGQRNGEYRIKFDAKITFGSPPAIGYIQIYRNGEAVGTEQSTEETNYDTFSEDISGWSSGDLCQVYAKRAQNATGVYIENFRIYSSNPIEPRTD